MVINTVLITQARMGSSRLPGKVLRKINGDSLLKIHLERIKKAKYVDAIIVATTLNEEDYKIENEVKELGVFSFSGSEDDVLDRYYQSIINAGIIPEWVVRVTSDCPLVDPNLIDEIIQLAKSSEVDYLSNTLIEHFPDGQDIEVFKFKSLKSAWQDATLKSDREHVTTYIKNNSDFKGKGIFKAINFPSIANFSSIRMTVDEEEDFKLIEILVNKLGTNESWLTYTNYILNNELFKINSNIVRNEGYLKSLLNDKK